MAIAPMFLQDSYRKVGRRRNSAIGTKISEPGCATGEEAYSIAMEIDRQLAGAGEAREIVIFATDVDQQALAFAAAGRYPPYGLAEAMGALPTALPRRAGASQHYQGR